VTTHAPLRSQRTTAQSVCHVRVLGDGDAPTSPVKIQGYQRSLARLGSALYRRLETVPDTFSSRFPSFAGAYAGSTHPTRADRH